MKTLEFIFQDTQIHFTQQHPADVLVNAIEMSKDFGKRIGNYLANKETKKFTSVLDRTGITVHSESKIAHNRGNMGSYLERAPNRAHSDLKITENRGHKGIYGVDFFVKRQPNGGRFFKLTKTNL